MEPRPETEEDTVDESDAEGGVQIRDALVEYIYDSR